MISDSANGDATAVAHPPEGSRGWLTFRELMLLLILAAVQFTHIVDFMIIMPLGPVFLKEMGLSPWQFGMVVSAYTITAGIAGLLAARYVDRFDRKPALLVLYAGFVGGTLLCAAAPDYPLLVAARAVAGGFGGVAAAMVLAIVGDAFPDSRRGIAMGVVMSAFSVASIAGVPFGLLLAEAHGWRTAFGTLGAFSAFILALAIFRLPRLRGHLEREQASSVSAWTVLTDPGHVRAFTLTVTLVLSTFMLGPYLATFLEANVGLVQAELKYIYLFGGLATLVTLTLFGRLSDRFGKLRIFRMLAVLTLIPILLVTNLPAGSALAAVLAVTTLFMVTSSGRMVPAMALITASSAPAYRGSFMSFNSAVQQLAMGLGTAIAGLLIHQTAGRTLTGFALVGALSCVATVASIFLAGYLHKDPGADLAPDSPVVTEVVEGEPVCP